MSYVVILIGLIMVFYQYTGEFIETTFNWMLQHPIELLGAVLIVYGIVLWRNTNK